MVAAYELQSAIVADTAGHEETLESNLADDRLHQALGQLCAEYLDTIVRQNEVVALSSGRAVFYACESLFNKHIFDKRNVRGVKVVSLNGNIAAEVWSMESPDARRAMDADISGAWLARAFPDAELIRLSLPVAVKSPEMVHEWLARGPGLWISPEMRGEKARSGNAPFGLPAEEEFLVLLRAGRDRRRARQVRPPVHRRAARADDGKSPAGAWQDDRPDQGPSPATATASFRSPSATCATGCSSLLPPGSRCPRRQVAELEEYVNAINARLLSITFEQLYLVPKVVVVAGGASKVDAIRSVLEWQAMGWKQPLVHDLCTDRETALRLLETQRASTRRS